jgi:hypothetical protein
MTWERQSMQSHGKGVIARLNWSLASITSFTFTQGTWATYILVYVQSCEHCFYAWAFFFFLWTNLKIPIVDLWAYGLDWVVQAPYHINDRVCIAVSENVLIAIIGWTFNEVSRWPLLQTRGSFLTFSRLQRVLQVLWCGDYLTHVRVSYLIMCHLSIYIFSIKSNYGSLVPEEA